ncbi:terminase small subunit [Halomonas sp. IOP_31]|uniref:terminase small subunit n=1 Tax=Halomonas sp. IOP_31 TaxID=2876584 RepID=UPI001E411EF2|nr:terminase small subunit [Halomonas sp. IOP_31]MCD6006897.1 terminase small subunit [Halomonas sp. IOP_31]
MAKLNDKQQRFVEEYIKDLSATNAALRAGYAETNARFQGAKLLAKEPIQLAIAEHIQSRTERTQIDADYVLNRLVEIDQMDVLDILKDDGSLKQVHEWPPVWRRYISGMDLAEMHEGRGDDRELVGVLKKIKWPDKVKNLELIGKHVDVQAFKDRVEQSGELTMKHEDLTDDELEARIARITGSSGKDRTS